MSESEPISVATIVAGMLSATGDLRADITAQDVQVAVSRLLRPATLWAATVDTVTELPADWTAPDSAVVVAASDALVRGWREGVANRRSTLGDLPLVLRLMLREPSDAEILLEVADVDGIAVTSFLPTALGRWRWRWPLRVGVASSAEADARVAAMIDDTEHAELYKIHPSADTSAPLDILITALGDNVPTDVTSVGAVIVLGRNADRDRAMLPEQITRGAAFDAGAVVALPGNEVDWLPDLVHELSRDRPLDAAIGIVRPDAVVEADPDFLAATSLRNWTSMIAANAVENGDLDLARALQPVTERYVFDDNTARAAGEAIAKAEENGLIREIQGGAETRTATVPQTPTDADEYRHVVARVSGRDDAERQQYFREGLEHSLFLRIARPGDDDVAASEPIMSPLFGRNVDLDVMVAVGGSRETAQTVKVRYPGFGDGPWSEPVTFIVPHSKSELSIFITVLWHRRTIQSATLTGQVFADGASPEGARLSFVVDVSNALPDEARQAADKTFVEIVGQGAEPLVFDGTSGRAIEPAQLQRAVDDVRRELISALRQPPSSLADSAAAIAQVAMHGVALRTALFYGDEGPFADAKWIHVMSFGVADIPFELIYDHEYPDTEKTVTICGPALAGERSCATECVDRLRDDRVCPFGFWGTSKVIERRVHSANRRDASISDQRVIPARRGSVVGVTQQANARDENASTRIATAVSDFVNAGSSVVVEGWSGLEQAVVQPRSLLCLVTHTIPGPHSGDFETKLELGVEARKLMAVTKKFINPADRQPGPVVLALGCDTGSIDASFATFVAQLHSVGAEIVVSATAQIPGKEVADFVERLMRHLTEELATVGEHRFGKVLTAARRETLCEGDVLALALTASGDGDVRIGDL